MLCESLLACFALTLLYLTRVRGLRFSSLEVLSGLGRLSSARGMTCFSSGSATAMACFSLLHSCPPMLSALVRSLSLFSLVFHS